MEFWVCAIFLWNHIRDCFVMHAWCAVSVFLQDGKFLVKAVQLFLKIRLKIVLLHTHDVHCLTCFVIENLCLRQFNLWTGAFFLENMIEDCWLRTHDVQFPFFLHGGKMFVEAGGILSLCNYPWKLDLRLWWYTRMVCSVCFLASCKVFY